MGLLWRTGDDARRSFAARVRPARIEAGMSQVDLARAAGVGRRTVINLENRHTLPADAVIAKIAAILHIEEIPSAVKEPQPRWLQAHLDAVADLLPLVADDARAALMEEYLRNLRANARGDSKGRSRSVTEGLLE